MTKPAKKNITPDKNSRKEKTTLYVAPQNKNNFAIFIIIAILTAIPFAMGKYIEFNSPGAFDSGSYIYSAKHILDGARIGVDEKPSALPGTLLINILGVSISGFNETGTKSIQMLLQAAMLVFMFITMRKIFGTLAAAIAVILASTCLSSPLIAKYGNVKEQYMIAFMVMGICSFMMRQAGGKFFWTILTGAFLAWAPLFKETGVSAIAATEIFVLLQPLLKNRTWKQTIADILLLFAGAFLSLVPVFLWLIIVKAVGYWPYAFVWNALFPVKQTAQLGNYISKGREMVPFSDQWPRVLRYYLLLRLPVALAIASIIARIIKFTFQLIKKSTAKKTVYDRFVLLLAAWWILDMAFVWISPYSYEEYYLPLNASAAMLGGYITALYSDRFKATLFKPKWAAIGFFSFIAMIILSWHIFFGIQKSPFSGNDYPGKQRGYAQKLAEISQQRKKNLIGPWEAVGQYIKNHSTQKDKIYVWGWFPGIYVQAQRLSAASKASLMPRPAPKVMEDSVKQLLAEFEREKPKFIVDSRKRDIPMERPPYELWPRVPEGFMGAKKTSFLPTDENIVTQYDILWAAELKQAFGEEEALRYKALKPFRQFVMQNYKIVNSFGDHVLFQLKDSKENKGQ
jgi:4-amino-4-deoxy-L-arabinose transferase-like glycosyltransferase